MIVLFKPQSSNVPSYFTLTILEQAMTALTPAVRLAAAWAYAVPEQAESPYDRADRPDGGWQAAVAGV